MADFQKAVELTLAHEGGFDDNKNDRGGATNMGIEQRDMPNVPIKDLTVEEAQEYYNDHFWMPLYNLIDSQKAANKIFDMGVLFGAKATVMLLQSVLGLPSDGVFGGATLAKVNEQDERDLLSMFQHRMAQHAQGVVAAHPQDSVFLKGWLNRINS